MPLKNKGLLELEAVRASYWETEPGAGVGPWEEEWLAGWGWRGSCVSDGLQEALGWGPGKHVSSPFLSDALCRGHALKGYLQ